MQALLFDLDGTLVDSIPLWIAANLQTLKGRGVEMTEQKFLTDFYQLGYHYHGILEKCGLAGENGQKFYQERNKLFEQLLQKKVEWLGEAGAVLKQCGKKVPLGLLTGAKRRAIEAMDVRLHFSNLFTEIITYDDTGDRMKPDPYGLLLLTERLTVDPRECVYVGDQYVDVQAAHSANMKCWLIPTNNTPTQTLAEADVILKSISDIPIQEL